MYLHHCSRLFFIMERKYKIAITYLVIPSFVYMQEKRATAGKPGINTPRKPEVSNNRHFLLGLFAKAKPRAMSSYSPV